MYVCLILSCRNLKRPLCVWKSLYRFLYMESLYRGLYIKFSNNGGLYMDNRHIFIGGLSIEVYIWMSLYIGVYIRVQIWSHYIGVYIGGSLYKGLYSGSYIEVYIWGPLYRGLCKVKRKSAKFYTIQRDNQFNQFIIDGTSSNF